MTPRQFLKQMKKIVEKEKQDGDHEVAHANADKLMCDVLTSLGYKSGVDLYEEITKW